MIVQCQFELRHRTYINRLEPSSCGVRINPGIIMYGIANK